MRLDIPLKPLPIVTVWAIVCALLGGPAAVRAAVEEVVEYRLLDAPAATAEAVAAAYRPAVPRPGHAAATAWQLDWHFDGLPRAAAGCTATNVRTRLAVLITLPRLSPADALSPFQQERLRQHEAGHLRLAQLAARRLDAELLALPPLPDCRALHDEAGRRAAVHVERLRRDQAAYDALTEHGQRPHGWPSAAAR